MTRFPLACAGLLAVLLLPGWATAALNDTGITQCANATQNTLPCPQAGRHWNPAINATVFPNYAAPIFGPNLVVNGDAEAGTGSVSGDNVLPVPGWTTSGNFTVVQYATSSSDFPTTGGPGPSNRGANFFAGGPNNSSSSASQVIDVSSGSLTIDTGNVTFALEGFLGGFASQGDNAVLTTTFRDAFSTILGVTSIGPVTPVGRSNVTGLLFTTTSGFLPVGTRSVELNLQMTRQAGSYNDGYADNLSFVLNLKATLPGDVNGDGLVNALDVVAVINAVLGIQPLPAADVNSDGAVNALDVVFVINRVLGL